MNIETEKDFLRYSLESLQVYDDLDRSYIAIEQLIELHEVLSSGKEMSAKDKKYVTIAAEMALIGTGKHANDLLPALESSDDLSIVCEELSTTINDSIKRAGVVLKKAISSEVNTLEYIFTIIDGNVSKIKKLKEEVNRLDNSTYAINVSDNKYLHVHKYDPITDLQRYDIEFSETTDVISRVNQLTDVFLQKDFMQSLKNYFSPLTGYDEKYLEMFRYLEKYIEGIKKIPNIGKGENDADEDRFTTNGLLGFYDLIVTSPKEDSYDLAILDECKNEYGKFSVRLDHNKPSGFKVSGSTMELTKVNKSNLIKLLDTTQRLLESYRQLCTIRNKLSVFGTQVVGYDLIKNSPHRLLALILDNYRLMGRINGIIAGITGDLFVYSKGLTSSTLNIVETAIKQKP
jgi:hypothetical protein